MYVSFLLLFFFPNGRTLKSKFFHQFVVSDFSSFHQNLPKEEWLLKLCLQVAPHVLNAGDGKFLRLYLPRLYFSLPPTFRRLSREFRSLRLVFAGKTLKRRSNTIDNVLSRFSSDKFSYSYLQWCSFKQICFVLVSATRCNLKNPS